MAEESNETKPKTAVFAVRTTAGQEKNVANLIEAKVKMNDLQIRFWKSSKSGRWWLQVPAKTKRKHNRHRLIPCSYNDYLSACQEDIPDRLVNAIKRFV